MGQDIILSLLHNIKLKFYSLASSIVQQHFVTNERAPASYILEEQTLGGGSARIQKKFMFAFDNPSEKVGSLETDYTFRLKIKAKTCCHSHESSLYVEL